MDITFLGATGTVTGSKYLITAGSKKILVDCGLFQGFKPLRLRNWQPLPVSPSTIDAVILTHAHLDHSGYLPVLVRNGFSGRIYCSRSTRDLCQVLLPDSGYLQEEEARYANKRKYSKHSPALPLYTREDAEGSLQRFRPVDYDHELELGNGMTFRLSPAGHILGAAFVRIEQRGRTLLFSGDLGRPGDPVMIPPSVVTGADYLVIESTYGDRTHPRIDPSTALAEVIHRTVLRGGTILVPAFAVGRAQAVLYLIHQLRISGTIPDLPVYLDSPMATEATDIYCDHRAEHRLAPDECQAMCRIAHSVNSVEESKRLDAMNHPMILISASGMATGGRVLHHLKTFAPDPRNTILFVGFQAGGTRGEALVNGAKSVKIHGEYIPVNAEVIIHDHLSAHADGSEIMEWLRRFETPPQMTFITHGEPKAADALRRRIEEELRWSCRVPDYGDRFSIP